MIYANYIFHPWAEKGGNTNNNDDDNDKRLYFPKIL